MTKNNHKIRTITARTPNQKRFIQAVNEYDFVFLDGVAGTGKTFLSVGIACEHLSKGKIEKIVFVRSSTHLVKAMGFVPGSWAEKSLAFFDQCVEYFMQFLGEPTFKKLWETHVIELTSTSIIRGRSFLNSMIIMEESEMSSAEDFILFLSRLDKGSKAIFIGDREQNGGNDGTWAKIIDNLEDEAASCILFTEDDICRHKNMYRICKKIKQIS